MTEDRDRRVQEILQQTLLLEPARRTAFLVETCAGDEALRTSVETLMQAQSDAATDLDRRIGPYRLVRELGSGGMGAVYLAERVEKGFQQRVAIKLIRRGMEFDEVIQRFRYERQILASLEHPNIARLLDGGATEEGVPYFVLEYIEGVPIDEYCRENNLSVSARIELFQHVCAAVHYAHQNLVIHRDLKPANILVTKEGVPKLLDFGIAKILQPEQFAMTIARTATWARPMTPAYASPEQVRGLTLTTASDVYSLGVVLYELLTGRRPYEIRGTSVRDIEQIVCEVEPERPSTLISKMSAGGDALQTRVREAATNPVSSPGPISRETKAPADDLDALRKLLAGDLDNIVLMALRKEPLRRYPSAEQLSEDLRRHLAGLPVLARPNTFRYIAEKFVRRNKAAVAAAALVLLTLIGGVIATNLQARVARAERARAEKRFNDVRQLANSFLFEFHDSIEKLPGSTPARALVVKRALEYLNNLSQEAGTDAALQDELATAYEKVGDIQGNPYRANLGDTPGAIENYRKALAIRERLSDGTPQGKLKLADTYERLGESVEITGDRTGALAAHRKALALRESLPGEDARGATARSLGYVGVSLVANGKFDEAMDFYRKATAMNQERLREKPDDADAQRRLAVMIYRTGNLLYLKQNYTGAIAAYLEAQPIFENLARDPNNAQARRELSQLYTELAVTVSQTKDLQRAVLIGEKALSMRQSLADADPTNSQARRDLAVAHMYLGQFFSQRHEPAGTQREMSAARALFESLAADESAPGLWRSDLAQCYEVHGDTQWNLTETEGLSNARRKRLFLESRRWYERAFELYSKLKQDAKLEARVEKKADAMRQAMQDCDREIAKY